MDTWKKRDRPKCLERRFEFQNYDATRNFLDSLAALSESKNIFPDISFGSTYVNITIRPESEAQNAEITDLEYKFASEIDGLLR